ncbi:MAG: MBL fold metallo-hydrolase [Spirochaetales bacterium]|jgi:L-ascorbate metabolism protein UlaG (beta-lactamase superfamily)|nr:MBL fold metallo-hydrolase [Exilispira sp.]NMC67768.1 MBL fold metallo-hydrolase [Spirochaetales bacterium]
MKKFILFLSLLFLFFSSISFNSYNNFNSSDNGTITYFGRSSIKIKTFDSFVIYIDPYASGDYSEVANLILVTHGHSDHNKISLVSKNDNTIIIAPKNAISGKYTVASENQTFKLGSISIETVAAYNKNHPKGTGLGYIITFGNFKFYHAGDTDLIEEMKQLTSKNITVAALPCDGYYNMGPKMATEAAKIIKPVYLMPIHSDPYGLFNENNIKLLNFENLLILKPNETISISDLKY